MELVNGGELFFATGLRRGAVALASVGECQPSQGATAKAERPNPEHFKRATRGAVDKAEHHNEIITVSAQALSGLCRWLLPVCVLPPAGFPLSSHNGRAGSAGVALASPHREI